MALAELPIYREYAHGRAVASIQSWNEVVGAISLEPEHFFLFKDISYKPGHEYVVRYYPLQKLSVVGLISKAKNKKL